MIICSELTTWKLAFTIQIYSIRGSFYVLKRGCQSAVEFSQKEMTVLNMYEAIKIFDMVNLHLCLSRKKETIDKSGVLIMGSGEYIFIHI